ncbi:hypothetical protein ACKU27_26670 [Sphingobium yanoikuyae]
MPMTFCRSCFNPRIPSPLYIASAPHLTCGAFAIINLLEQVQGIGSRTKSIFLREAATLLVNALLAVQAGCAAVKNGMKRARIQAYKPHTLRTSISSAKIKICHLLDIVSAAQAAK